MFRIAFPGAFLSLFRIKYYLFQQEDLEERCKLAQWGTGLPETTEFLIGFT